ncbi:MAG: hypothetical protein ACON39_08605 [Coraliomargaritaceae bacterium]
MRALLLVFLSCLLAACGTTSSPQEVSAVEILDILPKRMTTEQFMRIKEYRTGSEYTGKRLIIRTDPLQRDGFYFTLLLDTKLRHLPQGTVIVGEFYSKASTQMQTHTFVLPADRPNTKAVFLGLTGQAWPFAHEEAVVPSAWKFQIIGPDGQFFGQKQSYLWEK